VSRDWWYSPGRRSFISWGTCRIARMNGTSSSKIHLYEPHVREEREQALDSVVSQRVNLGGRWSTNSFVLTLEM
jgi:hypothetical protein